MPLKTLASGLISLIALFVLGCLDNPYDPKNIPDNLGVKFTVSSAVGDSVNVYCFSPVEFKVEFANRNNYKHVDSMFLMTSFDNPLAPIYKLELESQITQTVTYSDTGMQKAVLRVYEFKKVGAYYDRTIFVYVKPDNSASQFRVTILDAGTGAAGEGNYNAGATVSIKAGTVEYKNFKEWTSESAGVNFANNNSAETEFTMPARDVVVKAVFEPIVYAVTLEANGGTFTSSTSLRVDAEHGKTLGQLSIVEPIRANHIFDGWYNTPNAAGGTKYTNAYTVIGDVTLYARWIATYTVIYNGNGHTGGTVPIDSNSPYVLTSTVTVLGGGTLERRGYSFNGWSMAQGGGGKLYEQGEVFSITSNVTFFAQWVNYFVDSRDGQKYRIVEMPDGKTWMAENLNFATASGSSCYENSPDSCAKYGRLYDWDAAMSACPVGWKLPDNADWDALMTAVGGEETAGTKLKSRTGWFTGNGYIAGTDDFGFSALPGGYRWFDGSFYLVGHEGVWWSVTDLGGFGVYYRYMDYNDEGVGLYWDHKSSGHSVRCVRNER